MTMHVRAPLLGSGATLERLSRRAVLFITAPSGFLLDQRVFVTLGILKVAASAAQHGWYTPHLDLSGYEDYLNVLKARLANFYGESVALTATTPQLPYVIKIAEAIRRLRPDLKIILGGPHATLVYAARKLDVERGRIVGRGAEAARELERIFDVVCTGDGELAILRALEDDAPKFVDGDDMHGPYFLSDQMFTDGPEPARYLVDMQSYHYTIEGFRATSLVAQLGCPFGCGFCGGRHSKSLRKIRNRSVESIVKELQRLYEEYGYTAFMFYDDEMNVSKTFLQLMEALTVLQAWLGVEFRLRGFVKAELLTKEHAEAMYRAGFRWLLCGFEAANDRILTNINKQADLGDNTRCVEIAKAAGLKIKALMSCGHPGETRKSVLDIRDWLIRMKVDDFDCTVITVYPGTPYFDLAVPHRRKKGVWTYTHPKTGDRIHSREVDYTVTSDYYKGDPDGGYRSYVFTDHLSDKDIVKLRDMVERDVRKALNIPFNQSAAAMLYEHSMGQPGFPDLANRLGLAKAA